MSDPEARPAARVRIDDEDDDEDDDDVPVSEGVDLEDVDDLEEEADADEAHNEDGEHNGDDGDEARRPRRADARSKSASATCPDFRPRSWVTISSPSPQPSRPA